MRKCTTEVSRLKAVMERAGRRQVVLVEEEGARLRMCVCVCERERETEREGKRGREGGREEEKGGGRGRGVSFQSGLKRPAPLQGQCVQ